MSQDTDGEVRWLQGKRVAYSEFLTLVSSQKTTIMKIVPFVGQDQMQKGSVFTVELMGFSSKR